MKEITLLKKEVAQARQEIDSWTEWKKTAYRFAVSSGSVYSGVSDRAVHSRPQDTSVVALPPPKEGKIAHKK